MKNTKQGASIYFNNFPYLYPFLTEEKGDMGPMACDVQKQAIFTVSSNV